MAHIIIIGSGLGGMTMAFEMRENARPGDRITVVSNNPTFHFVPSNPWVAVNWRKREEVRVLALAEQPVRGGQRHHDSRFSARANRARCRHPVHRYRGQHQHHPANLQLLHLPALVLAERHLAGDEQFKVLALHAADDAPFESAKPCVAKWRAVTSRGGTPIPGGTG